MRICIEAQRLFRKKKHGMEVVALETIRALQEIDHQNEYHIIAADDEDSASLISKNNFTIHRLPPSFYPKWEQITLPRFVKKLQPDVLHCTANTAPLLYKGKMLVTIHDLIFMDKTDLAGSAYQKFGNYYRRLIVPRVAKKASMILTVSAYSKSEICKRLRIPENKVSVIYNGVNAHFAPEKDEQKKAQVRKKYALPNDFILHIGNTAPRKNTLTVIKAYDLYCQQQTNVLPLVISGCPADFIQDLLNRNQCQHLADKIIIPGYVSAEDFPTFYNLSNLFLYPSLQEGFGLPVVEAMACGVPVITSNGSSLVEIAGQAAKLVNPHDPHEIANAMQEVLQNTTLQQYMQTQGILNAMRFSWKAAAEQTLSAYNQLHRF